MAENDLYGLSSYGIDQGPSFGGKQVDLYQDRDRVKQQTEALRTLFELPHVKSYVPQEQAQRQYSGVAGGLREAMGAAYGIDTYGRIGNLAPSSAASKKEELGLSGNRAPLDPMVRLQEALMNQYQNYQVGQRQNRIRDILAGRQNTLTRLGSERSAAMGTPGLFQGAMTASEAARDTLANQAQAAYKPMQAALERQYTEQNEQLLAALEQLEQETQTTIRTMGQSSSGESGYY